MAAPRSRGSKAHGPTSLPAHAPRCARRPPLPLPPFPALQGASLCCGAYSLFVLAYEFYTANPLDLVSQLTRGLNHAALWAQAQAATQPTLVRLGGSLVWAPVLPGRFLSLTSWTVSGSQDAGGACLPTYTSLLPRDPPSAPPTRS